MIRKISITTLMAAIIDLVERNTGKRCYDAVPPNAESPFYYLELVSVRPKNAKSMYVDSYDFQFHCIADVDYSSVKIHELIQGLEEALTEDIALDDPYNLIRTVDNGVSVIKTDETGEKHAVCPVSFEISYGFICK